MPGDLDLGREFFRALVWIDDEIARRVAQAGCLVCGGRLHRGDYNRKPRGGLLAAAGEAFARRFSLCCACEGCRKRATPPSVRFLGRRVYLGAVVIVASIVALALQAAGEVAEIRRRTGVPARTVRRWRSWWRGPFVQSEVVVVLKAHLVGLDLGALPASIVDRLEGSAGERMRRLLVLLAPLTTSSVPDGSRFARGIA
jgi:hypothetical protein